MAKRVSSISTSALAAKVMKGYTPTKKELRSLAASVLSQRESRVVSKKKAVRK